MSNTKFPPAFQFSQSSIQDFVECQRRFQLRYLLQQAWPAPIAEPLNDYEAAERLGAQFHLLAQRYYLGVPVQRVEPSMLLWWDAFLQHQPTLPGVERLPEVLTSAVMAGQRITAAFDLLTYASNGEVVIVDWKTSRHRPKREWLDRRWQTILYPLLLVETAEQLIGLEVQPEQVKMLYWFANFPTEPKIFDYSTERYQQDKAKLEEILAQIGSIDQEIWTLTEDRRKCRLCQYRSLCDRGREAGGVEELELDPNVELNESDETFVL
ncbi:MAG: PD-(D/E)XK nuclease family protein [Anaerolineae bacterium]|nr:PD-(D/E)XK nuclease family protein [Anaerolineae bacterium]